MSGTPPEGGFTIVETLIVLAVSGILLLSSILLVAGQQRKVEFTQAVQDIQSVIKQTVSEVGAGYYPNAGDLRCVAGGAGLTITQVASGAPVQGSNTGCIFLGKAMQFGNSTTPQQYVVHAIAGLQDNQDGTLATARPKAVDVDTSRTVATMRNGLTVKSMKYIKNGFKTDIGAVAFLNGLGSYSGGKLMSGAQQLSLVPVTGSDTVPNTTVPHVVAAIDTNLKTADPLRNPNGGVEICFAGGTGQWGLVTIGGNGRDLSVKLDIKSTDCSI